MKKTAGDDHSLVSTLTVAWWWFWSGASCFFFQCCTCFFTSPPISPPLIVSSPFSSLTSFLSLSFSFSLSLSLSARKTPQEMSPDRSEEPMSAQSSYRTPASSAYPYRMAGQCSREGRETGEKKEESVVGSAEYNTRNERNNSRGIQKVRADRAFVELRESVTESVAIRSLSMEDQRGRFVSRRS